jgi:DNA invertase Pin-like site-specific DNA recombinase
VIYLIHTAISTKIWNVAIYVRLSKDDGDKDESDSISNQKDLIRSYIKDKPDLSFFNEYEDDGWSGVDFERPSFKRLLDDIRIGVVNCVIVKDLSRLGRNYIETGRLLERFFPFMGVRFIAINDNYDSINTNAQNDNLIIPFKNLINDSYCADISNKIRSQFEVRRKKGDFVGSFTTFGYIKNTDNKNQLIVDENTAPVVQDIFRWKVEGLNNQGIADRLNSMGIPSPMVYKKQMGSNFSTGFKTSRTMKWTPVAVWRILRNELYIGVLTQGITSTPNYRIKERIKKPREEWARVEQSHEPIISKADFILVAELMKKDTRKANNSSTVPIFSGMLFCGDCNQNLVRKSVPGNNKKYVYYVCAKHKKGNGCTSHNINDTAIYNAVYETVASHICMCEQINRVLDFINDMPLHRLNAQKLQRQIDDRNVELDKLKNRVIKVYEDFCDKVLSKDEFISFREVYVSQINDTEIALAQLQKELANIINNTSENCIWVDYFLKYRGIQSLTRNVVVELIERITVYEGGRIDVRPRYQANFEETLKYIDSLPVESLEGAVN